MISLFIAYEGERDPDRTLNWQYSHISLPYRSRLESAYQVFVVFVLAAGASLTLLLHLSDRLLLALSARVHDLTSAKACLTNLVASLELCLRSFLGTLTTQLLWDLDDASPPPTRRMGYIQWCPDEGTAQVTSNYHDVLRPMPNQLRSFSGTLPTQLLWDFNYAALGL